MTRLTTAAALAALLTAAAGPALAQTPDWSGLYIGGHGGWAGLDDADGETLRFDRDLDGSFNDTVTTATSANAFGPGFCGGTPNTAVAADGCEDDDDGSEFGARIGYDWQMGSWVFGVVGEYSAVDAQDSATGFSTTPANYVFTRDVESIAALRARIGYAMGPALIYVTGGFARASVENSFATTNGANAFTPSSDSDDADGRQFGAGLEYALGGGWSIGGEYLMTTLEPDDYVIRVTQGSAPPTNPFVLAPNTTGTDIIRSEDEIKLNSFRIGLNYRF